MSETAFISTRGSSLKRKAEESFQVVVFESHKPKGRQPKPAVGDEAKNCSPTKDNGFNIKRAKHEVVKFAMSGLEGSEKEEAKVRLAIKLGAKPKKNKYRNYKELKEERQKEKMEKMKDAKLQEVGKDRMGRSVVNTKNSKYKRKKEPGLLSIYGKVIKNEATKTKITKRK